MWAAESLYPLFPLLQMKNDFTGFVVVMVQFSLINAGIQRNPELYSSVCAGYGIPAPSPASKPWPVFS